MPYKLSPSKAKEMLSNPPGGRKLSKKQRGLFGVIASGAQTKLNKSGPGAGNGVKRGRKRKKRSAY